MLVDRALWKEIETKLICTGIPIVGLVILLTHLPNVNPLTDFNLVILMAINIFADLLSVTLQSGISVSLSYPIMICTLLLYGPAATMWVYIPASLVTQISKKKEPFKIIFNITQIAVAVYFANLFLGSLEPKIMISEHVWRIIIAVFIFDLLNFCQVVKVITLQVGGSFLQAFKDSWLKEMATVRPIYYAAGILMAICYEAQGILGELLVIAPVLGAFFQLNAQSELKNQTSRANTDALTSLNNRYALASWWERELPSILSNNKTLSVIMIDIDDFKQVNDHYGHDVGDLVLKSVAVILQDCVRRTDCVFRYGGEEFVVLLPESDLTGAKQVAERIRASIQRSKLPFLDNSSITVSIGLSNLTSRVIEEEGDIPNELIRRADNAMYVSKQSGKNQVQIYS